MLVADQRPRRLLALFVFVVLVSAHSAAQDSAPVNRALLFGVNRYADEIAGVPALEYAVPDAKELRDLLKDRNWDARGFFDEDVTRRRIVEELTRLALEAKQVDSVLIFFAGHGVREKTGREHTYWLTYPSKISSLAVEGIRLSHLLEYIQDIPADKKILLLDHCNSGDVERIGGSGAGSARAGAGTVTLAAAAGRNLAPKEEIRGSLSDKGPGGLVIIGSARDSAYEFDAIGHGLFTYGLLKALNSPDTDTNHDGKLSLSELWTQSQNEMNAAIKKVPEAANLRQDPVEILSGSGLMSWQLVDAPLDPTVDAAGLRAVLSRLEQEAGLDGIALAASLEAVRSWEKRLSQGGRPTGENRAVVDKLKTIRDLGSAASWEVKREMLEMELIQQGLIANVPD